MSAHDSPQSLSLLSLPPEILLESISHIAYTSGHLDQLRLVCHKFNHLITHYSQSLALSLLRLQFPPRCLAKFPGLCRSSASIDYTVLDELFIRFSTLNRISRHSHCLRLRCCKQAAWMRPEWLTLQSAGLYLLYRLNDTRDHKECVALIKSLPATSLAILLFTLKLCIHQLRSDGPDMLLLTRPPPANILRFELELACQELFLQHGPGFIDALLCHCPVAIKLVEQEVLNMEERQMPHGDGRLKDKTLIAEARCALADRLGGPVVDCCEGMWDLIQGLGALDEEDIEEVVNGEELGVRERRDSGSRMW